jgi:hypothetical protein
MPTDEEKLLAILSQPDEPLAEVEQVDKINELNELQQETLASLLESGMPSPEEIIRDAQIAEHNAVVQRRRDERLARRRARQTKGKRKRGR